MNHSDIIELHSKLDKANPATYIEAANWALELQGNPYKVTTVREAQIGLCGLFQSFLTNNQKTEAALLCWGNVLFDPRPRAVQMIWQDLEEFNKLLIIGPGAIGKSFTIAAWTVLDWCEWPLGTSTKLISTTAGHAKANTFSTLSMFHRESVIPLSGVVKDGFIGMGTTDKRSSIAVVAVPPGDDGKGRLQGFHPIPISTPHPKFGRMTRVRAIMDEGESIPSGIWQGVDNMLITMDASGSTKVAGATNPRLKESSFGQRVEPEKGWESVDRETSERWMSKQGWHVLRLDGKKCENVIEKKNIYPGMMSYEGFMSYMAKGAHHPETDTMARGWYPEGGTQFHVTPDYFFNDSVGIYTFIGMPNPVASLDPAFAEGGDNPVMTTGRYGQVIGFTPFGKSYVQFPRPINGLQIEQQFTIKKDLTPFMSKEVKNYLAALQARPEWFVIDKMQPVSEPILTPDGWRKIGELKINDCVIGSNGLPTKVIGVYPQADRRVMKVTCSDGSWTRCGPEHLWKVKNTRHKVSAVVSTEKLMHLVNKVKGSSRPQRQWSLPMLSGPVKYRETSNSLPVDAYLLGLLLGDGNLREYGVRFGSQDNEIMIAFEKCLPAGVVMKSDGHGNHSVVSAKRNVTPNILLHALRDLNLAGLKSYQKFIPEIYMRASFQERLNVLQGLMDTDGYSNSLNHAEFISTSKMLIRDIEDLVESLGGRTRPVKVTLARKQLMPASRHNGARTISDCRESYRLVVQLPDSMNPFRLTRKSRNIRPRKSQKLCRFVTSIEKDRDEQSVCIRVAAEDQLYVTRHCLVTHNTGNGLGLHDDLKVTFGDIMGIQWGEDATERKILEEDTLTAEERYQGVVSEMAFAFSTWLQYGYIKFAPMMDITKLRAQATGRKYTYKGKGLQRVQSKQDFKDESNGQSPDEYDSVIMLPHLIRIRHSQNAAMLPDHQRNPADTFQGLPRSVVDQITFYDVS